jgi:hypothetical protein
MNARANTTIAILEDYLISNNINTTANPSGVWYKVHKIAADTARRENDDRYSLIPQTINTQDNTFFITDQFGKKRVTYYYSKSQEPSSTLKQCIDRDDSAYINNLVTNFNDVQEHHVEAVRAYNRTCFPIIDSTLYLRKNTGKSSGGSVSVLEKNNQVFRSSFLHEQMSASASTDASLLYLDRDRISLLIKKTAHITTFYDNTDSVLCRAPTDKVQDTLPYNQDIDSIVCQLTDLALQNPTLPTLQATRRNIENNKVIDSVYTYIKKPEGGHGIMIDLISVSGFYIQSNSSFPTGFEYLEDLFAHQVIKHQELNPTSSYHQLLQDLDPLPSVDTANGQNMWTDLVVIATSLRSGPLESGFFIRITAVVTPGLDIPMGWRVFACVLFAIFVIIIAVSSRVASPIYKANLRLLLLSTLQYSIKVKANAIAEDGAIEMDDRSSTRTNVPLHNSKINDLYASVFRYGNENKDKHQLLTMDNISIVLVSEFETYGGTTEEA